ncbi:MAG: DNA gyrase inhibitor YacG [Oligoflexales bacterium]|nr:DNA gyrase inhibitor YacG [Oligoflexales bacterium]
MGNADVIFSCPRCKKSLKYDLQNKYRPFCSERCQQSDLYGWSEAEYRVEALEQDDELSESELSFLPTKEENDL